MKTIGRYTISLQEIPEGGSISFKLPGGAKSISVAYEIEVDPMASPFVPVTQYLIAFYVEEEKSIIVATERGREQQANPCYDRWFALIPTGGEIAQDVIYPPRFLGTVNCGGGKIFHVYEVGG